MNIIKWFKIKPRSSMTRSDHVYPARPASNIMADLDDFFAKKDKKKKGKGKKYASKTPQTLTEVSTPNNS